MWFLAHRITKPPYAGFLSGVLCRDGSWNVQIMRAVDSLVDPMLFEDRADAVEMAVRLTMGEATLEQAVRYSTPIEVLRWEIYRCH